MAGKRVYAFKAFVGYKPYRFRIRKHLSFTVFIYAALKGESSLGSEFRVFFLEGHGLNKPNDISELISPEYSDRIVQLQLTC